MLSGAKGLAELIFSRGCRSIAGKSLFKTGPALACLKKLLTLSRTPTAVILAACRLRFLATEAPRRNILRTRVTARIPSA